MLAAQDLVVFQIHLLEITIGDKTITYPIFLRQVPERTRSIRVPSCELWRSLVKFGELWRTHNVIFTRTSLTFTRVPAKAPHIHQSSSEGAFCMWVVFRMYPT